MSAAFVSRNERGCSFHPWHWLRVLRKFGRLAGPRQTSLLLVAATALVFPKSPLSPPPSLFSLSLSFPLFSVVFCCGFRRRRSIKSRHSRLIFPMMDGAAAFISFAFLPPALTSNSNSSKSRSAAGSRLLLHRTIIEETVARSHIDHLSPRARTFVYSLTNNRRRRGPPPSFH